MQPSRDQMLWLALGASVGVTCALVTVSQMRSSHIPASSGKCKAKVKGDNKAKGDNKSACDVTFSGAMVEIEYCAGCRWMQRAGWAAMELLTTFNAGEVGVSLVPNHAKPGGVFTVRVNGLVVYDRKAQTPPRFPEMKELKQLVRDIVTPTRGLGHSDSKK